MLKARDACQEQYDLFVELFPGGVEITEELCVKHAQDFDFEWASRNLLNAPHQKAYEEAMARNFFRASQL